MTRHSPSPTPALDALLALMSDPDPVVWKSVERQLLKLGAEIRAPLQETAENGGSPLVRARARDTLGKIHETALTRQFGEWLDPGGPEPSLEEGWFLLTHLEYPDLDVAGYRRQLDGMAADLDPLLRGARDVDALRVFQRYIHFDREFRGNVEGYYEPENSYLNCVLDRGVGIPITLSALYLLLAKRVGLPLEGVAAPGHFLLRYRRDRAGEPPVYIDAFHGGRNLNREECVAFIRALGHYVQDELDRPATARGILARMCRNLIGIYTAQGPAHKADRLTRWAELIEGAAAGSRGQEGESDSSRP